MNFSNFIGISDLDRYIFTLLSSKTRSEVCSVSKYILELSLTISKLLSKRPELYSICGCMFRRDTRQFNFMTIPEINSYLIEKK